MSAIDRPEAPVLKRRKPMRRTPTIASAALTMASGLASAADQPGSFPAWIDAKIIGGDQTNRYLTSANGRNWTRQGQHSHRQERLRTSTRSSVPYRRQLLMVRRLHEHPCSRQAADSLYTVSTSRNSTNTFLRHHQLRDRRRQARDAAPWKFLLERLPCSITKSTTRTRAEGRSGRDGYDLAPPAHLAQAEGPVSSSSPSAELLRHRVAGRKRPIIPCR